MIITLSPRPPPIQKNSWRQTNFHSHYPLPLSDLSHHCKVAVGPTTRPAKRRYVSHSLSLFKGHLRTNYYIVSFENYFPTIKNLFKIPPHHQSHFTHNLTIIFRLLTFLFFLNPPLMKLSLNYNHFIRPFVGIFEKKKKRMKENKNRRENHINQHNPHYGTIIHISPSF